MQTKRLTTISRRTGLMAISFISVSSFVHLLLTKGRKYVAHNYIMLTLTQTIPCKPKGND
jgi:hypothetical protein